MELEQVLPFISHTRMHATLSFGSHRACTLWHFAREPTRRWKMVVDVQILRKCIFKCNVCESHITNGNPENFHAVHTAMVFLSYHLHLNFKRIVFTIFRNAKWCYFGKWTNEWMEEYVFENCVCELRLWTISCAQLFVSASYFN